MDRKALVGLEKLRQCARVVAIPECAPTLVAYNNNAFPSESLNLITHREYLAILDQIDAQWHARRGERRKTIARLLVMLAFKAGLRRGELRGLRVANLLVLGRPMLRIFHRKEDPLKTPNAERTLPIHALLAESELTEILDWRQRRIEEGARLTDYLFSFTKKSGRIPNFFFDRLNGFLRANTRYANAGEGIHLHHCRHAFGAWLFAALLKSDQSTDSIFPDLPETLTWLRNGKVLSQQLYRSHGAPSSRKHPFLVATLCGHSSFDTTAGTYINIFPWLMANALDQAEDLAPDPGLVRKASGVNRKTSAKWSGKGDVNNIPLQRLRGKGATSNATRIEQPATFKGRQDWRIPIWKMLVSRGHGEIGQAVTPEMEAIFKRADWLKAVEPRHPLVELSDGPVSSTIAAPLKPCSYDEVSGSKFPDLVSQCYAEGGSKDDRKLLYKAAGIFAKHYMRNGFVRFESISDIEAADLYVEFLRRLGFGKRELELISGDMDQHSDSRKEWRDRLSEPYLLISPCVPKRNFYPKSSLWVRPKVDALAKRNSSAADFRFTMAMAFVAFGPILETPARLRAVQTPSSHRPYHSSQ